MRAEQSLTCLAARKHVQVEIPPADTLRGAEAVAAPRKKSGLVAMVGQPRRFNPSHQWVDKRIKAREFNIQQIDVQTYFFRRTNMNAPGRARSRIDPLLWRHAARTVDLLNDQTGGKFIAAIRGDRAPNASVAQGLPCYRVLDNIERQLHGGALKFPRASPTAVLNRPAGTRARRVAREPHASNRSSAKTRETQ